MEGGTESGKNWLLNRCDDSEGDRKTNGNSQASTLCA